MSVDIMCDSCGAVYEQDESVLGTEVQCACGQVFVATAPSPPPIELPAPTRVPAKPKVVSPIESQAPVDAEPVGAPEPIELPSPTRPGKKPGPVRPVRRTPKESPVSKAEEEPSPWGTIGLGFGAIVLGILSYFFLSWVEQQGSGFRTHVLIVLIYAIFGKVGVFYLLSGLGCLLILLGGFNLVAGDSKRRSGKRSSGMPVLVWVVIGGLLLVVVFVVWPGIQAARQAAERAKENHQQRQAERSGQPPAGRKNQSRNQRRQEQPQQKKHATRQPAQKPAEAGTTLSDIVGGSGGGPFRNIDKESRPMLGVTVRSGEWGGKPAFRKLMPVFAATAEQPEGTTTELARDGYAVGGLHIRADDYVRAVRLVFFRINGEQLDVSDSYLGEWHGDPKNGDLFEFVSTGPPVLGLHGRGGLVVDALGVVFKAAH